MANKRYTVMIFPETSSNPRKFRLSYNLIRGGCTFLLLLVLVAGFFVFKYSKLKKTQQKLVKFEQEYAEQQEALSLYAKTFQTLKQQLEVLQRDNMKFRIIAGLPQTRATQQLSGIGGEAGDTLREFYQKRRTDFVSELQQRLERLRLEAIGEENSLEELANVLKEKKSLLAATPSIWPTRGWLTSGFGYRNSPFTGKQEMHKGIDIATRVGTPIIVPATGTVLFTGRKGGLGKTVIIEHGYGYTTVYGHLSEILVETGERIKRAQLIAHVGNTGRSTGPHLHYEIRVNGVPVNPVNYLLD